MIFVPVARTNCRDDLEKVRKDVAQIKAKIPKKSAYQEQMELLQGACLEYEQQVKDLLKKLETVLSVNEELIRYIDNLEEVKKSGGLNIRVDPYHDFRKPTFVQTKTITIPEVKIVVFVEDF